MTPPNPTTFHEFARLCAIIRCSASGTGITWALVTVQLKWKDGSWRDYFDKSWESGWSLTEKEEITRRWTIFRLEQ